MWWVSEVGAPPPFALRLWVLALPSCIDHPFCIGSHICFIHPSLEPWLTPQFWLTFMDRLFSNPALRWLVWVWGSRWQFGKGRGRPQWRETYEASVYYFVHFQAIVYDYVRSFARKKRNDQFHCLGTLGFQDIEISGFRDFRISGFQDFGISGFRDFGISEFRDFWIPNFVTSGLWDFVTLGLQDLRPWPSSPLYYTYIYIYVFFNW